MVSPSKLGMCFGRKACPKKIFLLSRHCFFFFFFIFCRTCRKLATRKLTTSTPGTFRLLTRDHGRKTERKLTPTRPCAGKSPTDVNLSPSLPFFLFLVLRKKGSKSKKSYTERRTRAANLLRLLGFLSDLNQAVSRGKHVSRIHHQTLSRGWPGGACIRLIIIMHLTLVCEVIRLVQVQEKS